MFALCGCESQRKILGSSCWCEGKFRALTAEGVAVTSADPVLCKVSAWPIYYCYDDCLLYF